MGNMRHEQAMKELQRRRLEAGPRMKGAQAKPTPQQEFSALKHGYQRRKEEFFKKLNANTSKPASTVPARPSNARKSAFEARNTRSRIVSKSLPPTAAVSRRAPVSAIKSGFLTRRVDGSPVRRPASLAQGPKPAGLLPAIVSAQIGRRPPQRQPLGNRR